MTLRPVLRSPLRHPMRTVFERGVGHSAAALPVNTVAPSITGDPYIGETLTATPGAWTGADTVSGEWYVDGVATGDTDTSYTVLLADAGKPVEYRETATNGAGSVTQASNAISIGSLTAQVQALFASGESGIWYDPSDFATLFQDSAGTTPVTAVGQPVGLVLDKSGRGSHASQSSAALRPVLRQDGTGHYYLEFDGTDDFLVTGAVDFSVTSKIAAFVGVRTVSDSSTGTIIETHPNRTSPGGFGIRSSADGEARFGAGMTGATGTATAVTNADYAAPYTAVLSAQMDVGVLGYSGLGPVRVNGAPVSISYSGASVTATGNFNNGPVYLGRVGSPSVLHFNGRVYSVIVRGAACSPAETDSAEAYTNWKTGAY